MAPSRLLAGGAKPPPSGWPKKSEERSASSLQSLPIVTVPWLPPPPPNSTSPQRTQACHAPPYDWELMRSGAPFHTATRFLSRCAVVAEGRLAPWTTGTACARRWIATPKAAQVLPKAQCASTRPAVGGDAARRAVPATAYQSFSTTKTASDFRAEYATTQCGEGCPPLQQTPERVAGRVVGLREMGKMVFLTILSDGTTLQVVCTVAAGSFPTKAALTAATGQLRCGDVIGAVGMPWRTKRGELSLLASAVSVLAPFVSSDIAQCPDLNGHSVIVDPQLRLRYRFLDMLCSPKLTGTLRSRALLTASLRRFLDERRFVEVETPTFHQVPSGAAATPFVTHHAANNASLFLRIAPELYLKQCVVGGIDRVYEIGRVFRNEDADRSHNPEFTSCEFYQAYATYRDLMPMTEALLRQLCATVSAGTVNGPGGSHTVTLHHFGQSAVEDDVPPQGTRRLPTKDAKLVLDFSQPFPVLPVMPTLRERIGPALPDGKELFENPQGSIPKLVAVFEAHGIRLPAVRTVAKLMDKLIDHFITDRIEQPTFVVDHPICMSPLAKAHTDAPWLSERFELFVASIEVCNAYTELNDPAEQLRRFEHQMKERELGDDEAQGLDQTFLQALQVGLPPTAGWGMGIDRIAMLLTDSPSIRDVLAFPLLKHDAMSKDVRRRYRSAKFFGVDNDTVLFCLSSLEERFKREGGDAETIHRLTALRKCLTSMRANAVTVKDSPTPRNVARLRESVITSLSMLVQESAFDAVVSMLCSEPRR